MHLRMPSAVSKALSPGVWSLLGMQLCCHPQQAEEPSWEQVPPLETPLLPQTSLLDLVPLAWPHTAACTYLLHRGV